MTLKTVGSRIQVILRRVDNICLAFISTSSLLTLVSCLCSTIHTWSSPFFSHTVALSAFQCFQFINSCHCSLSFPLLLSALHLANMFFLSIFSLSPLFCLFPCYYLPLCPLPLFLPFCIHHLHPWSCLFSPQRTQSQGAQSTNPDGNPKSRKGLPVYVTPSLRAKVVACCAHTVHGGSLSFISRLYVLVSVD